MHDFLRNQNYSGRQFSGETQNARLALHIALYLRATQQRSGNWAPTHQGRSLRYTCHALEALHLLGLPAFHRLLDRGQNWLMNLSEEIDEESEEWTSIRLHPSRFKTLARLARFDDPQVRAEFDELCARINNQGLLNNVIQDPLLGSIIVCDCLLDLQQQNRLPASGLALLETTIPAVNDALVSWCDAPDPRDRNRLLGDISDASYALDVLLRAAYAGPAPALTDVVRRQMLSTLAAQQTTGPLAKDAIYSAIQLGTHFFHDAEVHTALDPFLEGLRVRYDRGQVQERNDDLHPLILRALVTCGGQPLREQIVGLLLDNAFNTLSQNQQVYKTTGQAFHLVQWVREVSGFEFVELEDADDWPPRAAYLVHLAARHERDENWKAAIDTYREAYDLLSPTMSEKELTRSAELGFRLAVCLKQAGRWSEAIKQQEANIATYRKLNDLTGKANAYMEMGHIYQMMNLYDPALLYYGEAYYLYRQVAETATDEAARRSARHSMANAKESLGNLEFQLKVLPKGVTDLEEARALYLDLDIPGKATIISQTLEAAQTAPGGNYV